MYLFSLRGWFHGRRNAWCLDAKICVYGEEDVSRRTEWELVDQISGNFETGLGDGMILPM